MEVSGKRRDPDLDKGSSDATVYCQPCRESGKRAVAQGFCQTCEEYMCVPCIDYHKKLKATRNHILLSKDMMPSFYPSTKLSDIGDTEYCKVHPKEMIKFYCSAHGDLGCGDCVVLNHRSCKVDYIADVAKDFINGKEFRELEPSIKQAEDSVSGSISNVKELFAEVENQSKNEIVKLTKVRREINAYLERREKELLGNIQKIKIEDESVLNAIKTDCDLAKTGLVAMRTQLTSGDISLSQRYVAARRSQKQLHVIRVEMEKRTSQMKARKYRFTKDPDMERLLRLNMGLGTLDMAGEFRVEIPDHVPDLSTVTWQKEADIDVRTSHDQNDCWITGSALLTPSFILLADFNNRSLKQLDITTRTVTSSLQLLSGPWDVCVLPDAQAAVTLPNKSIIQLFSTKGGQLSRGIEIKVSDDCRGIAFHNNRLYVSYKSNPRIEVMALDDRIISTFQTDDGIFRHPYYLTVSASSSPTLYVSDLMADRVLQLALDGKVLRKYVDKQLKRPESVVEVGPGQLLVCGLGSNNVILLTEKDGKMVEILGEKDGLFGPFSVTFCPHTRHIVVANDDHNSLKVFMGK